MERYDLLVIGGGAAGLSAARAAVQNGARVLLCERDAALGGVLPQCVHPGFTPEGLTGPEYAARLLDALPEQVAVKLSCTVLSLSPDRTALLSSPAGLEHAAFSACILAAGCRETPVGALPVCGARPAGVLTAGQAQYLTERCHVRVGERIVLLGSGDIGQIMARRFTQLGMTVAAVVEKADRLGGLERNRRECIEALRIPVLLRSTVTAVHGTGRVSGVTVRHLDTGREELLPCDTLVTALGLVPERELADALTGGGERPRWLALAGNCDHIHEIVTSAAAQGADLGARWKELSAP